MRLPPLCRYFRGGLLFGLILFLGVLLEPRDADLGSLLSVSLGSWGGRLPAAAENLKNRTPLPVLPKGLPPSVLAVPRDLRVFPYPKSQSARYLQHLAVACSS